MENRIHKNIEKEGVHKHMWVIFPIAFPFEGRGPFERKAQKPKSDVAYVYRQ